MKITIFQLKTGFILGHPWNFIRWFMIRLQNIHAAKTSNYTVEGDFQVCHNIIKKLKDIVNVCLRVQESLAYRHNIQKHPIQIYSGMEASKMMQWNSILGILLEVCENFCAIPIMSH